MAPLGLRGRLEHDAARRGTRSEPGKCGHGRAARPGVDRHRHSQAEHAFTDASSAVRVPGDPVDRRHDHPVERSGSDVQCKPHRPIGELRLESHVDGLHPCDSGWTHARIVYRLLHDVRRRPQRKRRSDGNALSTNQSLPFTILQAQSNTLDVTLGGLPHQFSIVPQGAGAAAPFVLGSQSVGYRLAGRFTQSFFVVAQDADGNPIIGAGAPAYAISTAGTPPVTIAQPVSTGTNAAPNTFALTPTSATASAYQVTVTATYPPGLSGTCSGSGVSCTASIAVTNVPLVAEGEILYGGVMIYAGSDPAVVASTAAGVELQGTTAMTFDPSGNLFVTDSAGQHDVLIARPPYATTEAIAGAPGEPFGLPFSVAVDATQHLYVADVGFGQVFIFSYATTPATYVGSFPTGSQPQSVTVNGAGTVLTANSGGPTVTVYNPAFASTPTTLGDARFAQPVALASFGTTTFVADRSASSSGAVFVLKPATSAPYESVVTEITAGMNMPGSVTVDANGNLFVVQSGSNVTEYTAASNYTAMTTISTALTQPSVAAVDGAGTLYVGDFGYLAIFGPPYTGAPAITRVSLPSPGVVYGLTTSD